MTSKLGHYINKYVMKSKVHHDVKRVMWGDDYVFFTISVTFMCICVSEAHYHTIISLNVGRLLQTICSDRWVEL